MPDKPPPELIRLLFEEHADMLARHGSERLLRWAEAFETWLEERYSQFSRNVGKQSHLAWREFLAFSQKAPWEVGVEDVQAYIEMLEGRGLSPATIEGRLSGLSKFYLFCQRQGVDAVRGAEYGAECGAEYGAENRAVFNPVRGAQRPKRNRYEKANTLSREAERALLEAMRRDPSPTGKRDYALFLTLLITGRRVCEIRLLKWGAVEYEGERAWMRLERGGKTQRVEPPRVVWEAIMEWLMAAGRLGTIQAEEYVFAPGRQPLVREAAGRAEDWDGERPLSLVQVHCLLKQHAGWAGLGEEQVTCHTLRHTAAVRMQEAGETAENIRTRLGRVSLSQTRVYLRRLAECELGDPSLGPSRAQDSALDRVANGEVRRADREEGWVPDRGPHRWKKRHHWTLKHGLYAKYLPEMEWLEEQGYRLEGLEAEIVRYRIVMERALWLTGETEIIREMCSLVNALGVAATRSAKLKVLKRKLEEAREREEW